MVERKSSHFAIFLDLSLLGNFKEEKFDKLVTNTYVLGQQFTKCSVEILQALRSIQGLMKLKLLLKLQQNLIIITFFFFCFHSFMRYSDVLVRYQELQLFGKTVTIFLPFLYLYEASFSSLSPPNIIAQQTKCII